MNPKLSSTLKMAAALWLKEAVDQHIDPHPDQQAELQRCLTSHGCDVRVVFHSRANRVSVETVDYTEADKVKVAELYRDQLIPSDAPDTSSTKQ
jgi:hypothetical protein